MADSNIGSLPLAESLNDDSLLVAEQQGEAVSVKGKILKDYAKQGADELVKAAQDAAAKAEQAAQDAEDAASKIQDVSDDVAAAVAAAQAAENARAAAVAAQQSAEQAAALAAQQAVSNVETKLQGYVSDAEKAKTDAQAAAENAANDATQQVESKLQGYVTDAENAKNDAQSAAGTAATDAVNSVNTQLAQHVSDAQAAQKAAEDAAAEAKAIAGGNFVSTEYVDQKAASAESNANKYTDEKIAAIPTPDVSGQIGVHNTATDAHNDIRLLITELTTRFNALANSTDVDLDQLAELVAYIKDNRSLIEQITTNKVNVSDIIDNLTTNVSNKPLSAAQGVVLKALIDAAASAASAAQNTANAALPISGGAMQGPILPSGDIDLGSISNKWFQIFTKIVYFFDASGQNSPYAFGMYQWGNNYTFVVRDAATNGFIADLWQINGDTRVTNFNSKPTVNGVSLVTQDDLAGVGASGGGIPVVNATSTDGIYYTATVDGVTSYDDLPLMLLVPNMDSVQGSVVYLNVNELGNVSLTMRVVASDSGGLRSGAFKMLRSNAPNVFAKKSSTYENITNHVPWVTALSGTFGGEVAANTGSQTPSTKLLRNSKLMDATTFDAVTDWSTHLTNGEIAWRYG